MIMSTQSEGQHPPLGAPSDARELTLVALLIFSAVLSGTLLIPAVRPFMAGIAPGSDGAAHAFVSLNLLGGMLGAPLLGWLADRSGARRSLLAALAALDGMLLLLCAARPPLAIVLVARGLQGAANMGALSLLLAGLRGHGSGREGRTMGLAGSAMIAAVAVGAPLGALLLGRGEQAPIIAAGLLALAVAGGSLALSPPPAPVRASVSPWSLLGRPQLLRLPVLWIAVERFAVGCLVVTFSLHARDRLGLDGRAAGFLLSWFVVPFALAVYPLGRFGDRLGRAALVAGGFGAYGLGLIVLGRVPAALLPVLLLCLGLASAFIYAPSLCWAGALAPRGLRATAMALLNAAGGLGMLLGTALAGVLGAQLRRRGWGAGAHEVIFALAGLVQLVALAASARALGRMADGGLRASQLGTEVVQ
jgi:AAHS family 3-hydroxyphenylpropionic acid transporter